MSDVEGQDERLVYMANQIARNFLVEGEAQAVLATAEHLKKFWDPRMKSRILLALREGNANLLPVTKLALEQLSKY